MNHLVVAGFTPTGTVQRPNVDLFSWIDSWNLQAITAGVTEERLRSEWGFIWVADPEGRRTIMGGSRKGVGWDSRGRGKRQEVGAGKLSEERETAIPTWIILRYML